MATLELERAARRPLERLGSALADRLGGPARTRVIVLLAAVLALESADLSTIGAVGPQLESAFHIHHARLGLLASSSLLIAAVATLPFGWLVDRVRRVRLLALTIVLWAAAMVAAGASTSYPMLFGARLALGGVMAVGGPALASLVGDYFEPGERGRILGFIAVGELLGAAFGFIICGNVGALAGWRFAFWAMAPGAVVLGTLLLKYLPEPARGGTSRLQPGTRRFHTAPRGAPRRAATPRLATSRAFVYLLRIRTNVLLIAASAVGYFFFAGMRTFGVAFLRAHFSMSTSGTTLLVPAFGVGALAGVLVAGPLADRLLRGGNRRARLTVAAAAYTAAAVLLIPGIVSTSLGVALVFYVLAAAGLSGANPPLDAARLDIVPSWLWGRAESLRTFLRQLAQAFAPIAFGLVADWLGGRSGQGLEYAFLIMLVPLLCSAGIVWRGRCSYPADTDRAADAEEHIP